MFVVFFSVFAHLLLFVFWSLAPECVDPWGRPAVGRGQSASLLLLHLQPLLSTNFSLSATSIVFLASTSIGGFGQNDAAHIFTFCNQSVRCLYCNETVHDVLNSMFIVVLHFRVCFLVWPCALVLLCWYCLLQRGLDRGRPCKALRNCPDDRQAYAPGHWTLRLNSSFLLYILTTSYFFPWEWLLFSQLSIPQVCFLNLTWSICADVFQNS